MELLVTYSCKLWKFYEDYTKNRSKTQNLTSFLKDHPYLENIAHEVCYIICDFLQKYLEFEPEELSSYKLNLEQCILKNENFHQALSTYELKICLKEYYPTWFLVEPLKEMKIEPHKIYYFAKKVPQFLYMTIYLSKVYCSHPLGRPKNRGIVEFTYNSFKTNTSFIY